MPAFCSAWPAPRRGRRTARRILGTGRDSARPGSRPWRAVISAASSAGTMPSLSVVQTVPSRRRKLAPALSSPPKPSEPSNSPSANHLKPTGTSNSLRPSRWRRGRSSLLLTTVLPTAAFALHCGRLLEQVVDHHRQVVVRRQQPGAAASRRRGGRGRCRRRRRRRSGPSARSAAAWRTTTTDPCGSARPSPGVMKEKVGSTCSLTTSRSRR